MFLQRLLNILKENTIRGLAVNIVLAITVFTLGLFLFYEVYLPIATHHGQTVTVPDLRGMTIPEIEKFMEGKEFRFEVSDSSYTDTLPPNSVIAQYPPQNAKVKLNRKIYLTLNTANAPEVKIPEVIDVLRDNAQKIINSYGLKVGTVEYEPDYAANVVLKVVYKGKALGKEELRKGVKLPKGSVVDLILGDGLGTIDVEIPQVEGMQLAEAEELLSAFGLSIGKITYTNSTEPTGTIINQVPDASEGKIRLGSSISLWVAGFDPATTIKE
jgi:beta-lactam-binding protein with PASTA domain